MKEKAQENTIFTFTKKKTMTAEKKQYQEQKGEAEQFMANLKRQKDLQRDYALWQLRGIDTDKRRSEDDLTVQNAELKKAQQAQVCRSYYLHPTL